MANGAASVKAVAALRGRWHRTIMSGPARSTPDDRAERLAQQLRENLKRRKAQARAVQDVSKSAAESPADENQ
ncbi:hypothetical protein [Sphingomonas crocodyli]|uniref:Uncharacterized protein n=1 Tax=Sphingomonas crocodyli TaxID=1979270 RepID=A0A437M0I7_9SPHN|nr:hypothetical protein [Sphingomonas crocodyli]RVT91086.1 hypothetical protein EOD43_16300 [Sphingomonas crocodyli]